CERHARVEPAVELCEQGLDRPSGARIVDEEYIARLGRAPPRRMECDRPPPRVLGPHRYDACALFELFEPIGHAGGDNGIGEEGLRITGRYELDVSVAAESRDGVERPSLPPARPESKRSSQFLATGVGAPFSRPQPVRVLTRWAELLC